MNRERVRASETGRAPLRRTWRPRPLPGAAREQGLLVAICAALARLAMAHGLAIRTMSADEVLLYRLVDPVTGDESLMGEWLDSAGRRAGALVANPDGSFYAEQSFASGGVVESIRAWGADVEEIHCEAHLLHAS